MRNWINLFEEKARGKFTNDYVNNTGPIGDLEDAVGMWLQGDVREAEPLLLSMKDIAQQYRASYYDNLVRAITLKQPNFTELLKTGLTLTHHKGKMLESWSLDDECVCDYMSTYDGTPWIAIVADKHEILIDLTVFRDEVNPHTPTYQEEVIVIAPPSRLYTPNELYVSKYVVKFFDLADIPDFDTINELHPIGYYNWK